jgi:hypothetical protein
MSKVTIQGDASGTGIFTIASPNSNTDRTLTLPDEAGTVLTKAAGSPDNSVVVDASGNVGIGTSSPSYRLHVAAAGNSIGGYFYTPSGQSGIRIETAANDKAVAEFYTNGNRNWAIGPGQTTAGAFEFKDVTASATRMLIDSSGNLLVGTTSAVGSSVGAGFQVLSNGGTGSTINIGHPSSAGSGFSYALFAYNNAFIGSIGQSGTTAVAYNTTSDYRLKENITPLTSALARIVALKPCTYTWKSAPDEVGEGFIAHELAEVCPQAVTGEKDAVDAEGNPQYQGIDTSFLVATLTAAIQEQQAIIESLTARVVALEGQP